MRVKNKSIALLLCVLLLAGMLPPVTVYAGGPSESWQDEGIPDTQWYTDQTAEGKGAAEGDPYVIDTAGELAGLAKLANAGNTFANKFIRLDADIDLAGKKWVSIGTIGCRFGGVLDGNGHIVSNLTMYIEDYGYAGLFGWLSLDPGTYGIKNLGVVNVDISGEMRDAGALAGYVEFDGNSRHPVFENCFATGRISSAGTISALGGLFGRIAMSNDTNCTLTIKNCYSSCDIAVTNTDNGDGYTRYAGGLIALIQNLSSNSTFTVSNCYSASRVRTANPNRTRVGGFAGHVNSEARITMTNCLFDPQAAGVGYGFSSLGVSCAGVEGLLTSEMTGALPAGWDGSIWLAEADMYPRLGAFEENDSSLASAIPLFLFENPAVAGLSDTRANVRRSFTVPEIDGAVWSASPSGILSFTATQAAFASPATDTEATITAELPSGARQTYTVLCKSGAAPGDETPPSVTIGSITPSDFSASIPVTTNEAADIYVLALPSAQAAPDAGGVINDGRTKKGGGTAFTAAVGSLQHSTDYVAYAVAIDPTGNVSDVKIAEFTTQLDHTPPSWMEYSNVTVSGGTASFGCTYNENGALKYVVLPGTQAAPNKMQVAAGKDASGNPADHAYTLDYTGGRATVSIDISDLALGLYRIYLVCVDAFGNTSNVLSDLFSFEIRGTVAFTVTDGANPIQDASITVGATTQTTDANGQAAFSSLSAGNYSYQITKTGYPSASDVFVVDTQGKSITVALAEPTLVTLQAALADGAAAAATSTKIDLIFDEAVTGLTSNHIAITSGTGAAVKGALTGGGTAWSVALTSVTAQGDVSVAVASPVGYSISGSPKTVAVYLYRALSSDATLSDLKINGATVAGFAADDFSYDVELPHGTLPGSPAATVGAAANDAAAAVAITQAAALPGSASVRVTAEDGTAKTYTVSFTLAPAPTYGVTVQNDGNGTGSADPAAAAQGVEVTLSSSPDPGYHFKEWQVVSGSVTIAGNKFTMPAGDVIIKAVFEADVPTDALPLLFVVGEGENKFYYGVPPFGVTAAEDLEGWSFHDGVLTLDGFTWQTTAENALTIIGGEDDELAIRLADGSENSIISNFNGSGDEYTAGIFVGIGGLTIEGGTGSLTVRGGGTKRGFSIGIYAVYGAIEITGGHVTAESSNWSGGLSGTCYAIGSLGKITISGGTVDAVANESKTSCYGIYGREVTIEGGVVNVTAGRANGGGMLVKQKGVSVGLGSVIGNVVITGGTVNAESLGATNLSAGIGAIGDAKAIESGGKVLITGGSVTASAGGGTDDESLSFGIAAVRLNEADMTIEGSILSISDSTVTATGHTLALFTLGPVSVAFDGGYRYWTNTNASEAEAAGPFDGSETPFDNTGGMYKYVKLAPGSAFTVTFESNGSVYATKTVEAGESVGSADWPVAPTRSGCTFGGWFTGENGAGNKFTSSTTVNASITVYAKWTCADGGSMPSAPSYSAEVSDGSSLPMNVSAAADSASVNLGKLTGYLSDGGSAVVTLPAIHGVGAFTATLPAASLTSGTGSLTLDTGLGSVTIPGNMLSGMNLTGSAGITIGEGDQSKLPDQVKEALSGRPLIRLTLTVNGRQADWRNDSAPVTVSVPYTPTAAELLNPESIVIWYIDGGGSILCVPNGRYDLATGTVTFSTTHFSQYAVAYNETAFGDVAAGAWYEKAVRFIAAREITEGTGSGNYSPEAKLTRVEFLVMMMRAYGIEPDANPENNFADAGNTWFTGYLAAAKRLGIAAGVGDNLFAPQREITRQEMFTLLYNALKALGKLPEGALGKTLAGFTDASEVASWATQAMTALVRSGTVAGIGGKLNPTGTATRAEMAQVLYNLLGK